MPEKDEFIIEKADIEDVRTLIVRISERRINELYGKDSKYCNGKPVVLEKNGKKVYAVLQVSDNVEDNGIKADYWMRQKLNAKVNDRIRIRISKWARLSLFWKTRVLNHPDLNQRWENFGILLAVIVLFGDIFLRLAETHLQLELLIIIFSLILLIGGIALPNLLLPHE